MAVDTDGWLVTVEWLQRQNGEIKIGTLNDRTLKCSDLVASKRHSERSVTLYGHHKHSKQTISICVFDVSALCAVTFKFNSVHIY